MKQEIEIYATISKMYKLNVEIEDGRECEDEDCTHEQNVALREKLDEIEQSLGDYLGNEQDLDHFIENTGSATNVKQIDHCSGSDSWEIEWNY